MNDPVLKKPPPHLEGLLLLQDSRKFGKKNWREKHILVTRDTLYIHKPQVKSKKDKTGGFETLSFNNDHKELKSIPLSQVEISEAIATHAPEGRSVNWAFQLKVNEETTIFLASSFEDQKHWVEGLQYVKKFWISKHEAELMEKKTKQHFLTDAKGREDQTSKNNFTISITGYDGKTRVIKLPEDARFSQLYRAINGDGPCATCSMCLIREKAAQLWAIDKQGSDFMVRKLEKIYPRFQQGCQFFLLEHGFKLLVAQFSDGKFLAAPVEATIKAAEVMKVETFAAKLTMIGCTNVGLFLVKPDGQELQFRDDEIPLEFFYKKKDGIWKRDANAEGKLVLRNKYSKQRTASMEPDVTLLHSGKNRAQKIITDDAQKLVSKELNRLRKKQADRPDNQMEFSDQHFSNGLDTDRTRSRSYPPAANPFNNAEEPGEDPRYDICGSEPVVSTIEPADLNPVFLSTSLTERYTRLKSYKNPGQSNIPDLDQSRTGTENVSDDNVSPSEVFVSRSGNNLNPEGSGYSIRREKSLIRDIFAGLVSKPAVGNVDQCEGDNTAPIRPATDMATDMATELVTEEILPGSAETDCLSDNRIYCPGNKDKAEHPEYCNNNGAGDDSITSHQVTPVEKKLQKYENNKPAKYRVLEANNDLVKEPESCAENRENELPDSVKSTEFQVSAHSKYRDEISEEIRIKNEHDVITEAKVEEGETRFQEVDSRDSDLSLSLDIGIADHCSDDNNKGLCLTVSESCDKGKVEISQNNQCDKESSLAGGISSTAVADELDEYLKESIKTYDNTGRKEGDIPRKEGDIPRKEGDIPRKQPFESDNSEQLVHNLDGNIRCESLAGNEDSSTQGDTNERSTEVAENIHISATKDNTNIIHSDIDVFAENSINNIAQVKVNIELHEPDRKHNNIGVILPRRPTEASKMTTLEIRDSRQSEHTDSDSEVSSIESFMESFNGNLPKGNDDSLGTILDRPGFPAASLTGGQHIKIAGMSPVPVKREFEGRQTRSSPVPSDSRSADVNKNLKEHSVYDRGSPQGDTTDIYAHANEDDEGSTSIRSKRRNAFREGSIFKEFKQQKIKRNIMEKAKAKEAEEKRIEAECQQKQLVNKEIEKSTDEVISKKSSTTLPRNLPSRDHPEEDQNCRETVTLPRSFPINSNTTEMPASLPKSLETREKSASISSRGSSSCIVCMDRNEKPFPVKTCKLIYLVLQQCSKPGLVQTEPNQYDYICLSGVHLRNNNGAWELTDDTAFHSQSELTDSLEIIKSQTTSRTDDAIASKIVREKKVMLGNGVCCHWIPKKNGLRGKWRVIKSELVSKTNDECEQDLIARPISSPVPYDVSRNEGNQELSRDESIASTLTGFKHKMTSKVKDALAQVTSGPPSRSSSRASLRSASPEPANVYMSLELIAIREQILVPINRAVNQIRQHFCAPAKHDITAATHQLQLGDDTTTPAIGWLVRRNLCSALAGLLLLGMKSDTAMPRFLFGKQTRYNLWALIKDVAGACVDEPVMWQMVQIIQESPFLFDDDLRFRCFVCETLNCPNETGAEKLFMKWFKTLLTAKPVIEKFYKVGCFWRNQSETGLIAEETCLILSHLNEYHFNLQPDFEYRELRKRSVEQNQDLDFKLQRQHKEMDTGVFVFE